MRLILQMEAGRKWTAADAAIKLYCSEATLRHHLASEGTHLRELLNAIRMNTGLNLMLDSARRMDEIAQACGHDSTSRFSLRCRQRFAQSPTKMRATR